MSQLLLQQNREQRASSFFKLIFGFTTTSYCGSFSLSDHMLPSLDVGSFHSPVTTSSFHHYLCVWGRCPRNHRELLRSLLLRSLLSAAYSILSSSFLIPALVTLLWTLLAGSERALKVRRLRIIQFASWMVTNLPTYLHCLWTGKFPSCGPRQDTRGSSQPLTKTTLTIQRHLLDFHQWGFSLHLWKPFLVAPHHLQCSSCICDGKVILTNYRVD